MRKLVGEFRVNKHKNKNDYIRTDSGVWIRNLTKKAKALNINTDLASVEDYKTFIKNEAENSKLNLPNIDSEQLIVNKCVIVSDGYDFINKQKLLLNLPKSVYVFAVNGTLSKWTIEKSILAYVINNPYSECMSFFPKHKYFPRCISSSRTYTDFIRDYTRKKGLVYQYSPTPETNFAGVMRHAQYHIDDYRNPICAAISLAYRFGATKIALLCCDDSFKDNRPAAEMLENGLYQYPQQDISHEIIDTNLLWLNQEVKVVDHSSGKQYVNAPYIQEDKLVEFLKMNDKDRDPLFSLDEFKAWMNSQKNKSFSFRENDKDEERIKVRPKIHPRKLINKISVEDGDAYEIMKDFVSNGGYIEDQDGKCLLIEVEAGTFYVSVNYVKTI